MERLLFALLFELPVRLTVLAVVLAFQFLVLVARLLLACVKLLVVCARAPFTLLFSSARLLSHSALIPTGAVVWGVPAYVRRPIPSEVKQRVWARDGGRCVLCGSRYELHYDHDIPVSKGGSNTVKNIRLLCARCNLRKGAKIE